MNQSRAQEAVYKHMRFNHRNLLPDETCDRLHCEICGNGSEDERPSIMEREWRGE